MTIHQLTEATPEILRDLAALAAALHTDGRRPIASELTAMLEDKNSVLLVADEGGRIVGMATLFIFQRLGKRSAYLEDVVVLPEYRGRGIGTKLMEAVIAKARERKAASILLTSQPKRVTAQKLYRSFGFVRRDTDVFRLTL